MRILIPGWSMGANSFGVTIPYLEYLRNYGEVTILTPSLETREGDLLILPGGKDILSSKYGELPSYYNSDPDVHKEFFFDKNLQNYIDSGIAIFGICLGMQQLQVKAGGKLVQNCTHATSMKSRDEEVHYVYLTQEYRHVGEELKLELVGNKSKNYKIKVNSLHHQGVHRDDLAACYKPVGIAADGIVEAMIHRELPIAAVQWHPEELCDILSESLIQTILEKSTVKHTALEN